VERVSDCRLWIPAFAGMTTVALGMTVSRVGAGVTGGNSGMRICGKVVLAVFRVFVGILGGVLKLSGRACSMIGL